MAANGLDATLYRGWIDSEIELSEDMAVLFSEFVIGTPAYGLSGKGRELYRHFRYITIEDYHNLYLKLTENIDLRCFETYEELKNEIMGNETMRFSYAVPCIDKERAFLYVGKISESDIYKAFFKEDGSITKGKKKNQIKNESDQRRTAVHIDKLFYHLRNGLAHGRYATTTQEGVSYLILQDESGKNISARIVIKMDTLFSWIEYLRAREQEIVKELAVV